MSLLDKQPREGSHYVVGHQPDHSTPTMSMNQRIPAASCLLVLAASLVTPAFATFPIELIDCDFFDTESVNFLDHNFGFGTEMTLSEGLLTPISTGLQGFIAAPEQVAQVPDFASGVDLPTSGQSLSDLFGEGVTPPPYLQEGSSWQSIQGEGTFGGGFSEVTINQRALLEGAQDSGEFVNVRALSKGYAPFHATSDSDDPIDVRLTFDLFSYFDVTGGGGLSQSIGGALLDVTDPEAPALMDGVSGFFFAGEDDVFANFAMGAEGDELTENFFSGPESTEPGARQIASFFYTIETQITPGKTYGIGLFGDAAIDLDGASSALLDSQNTTSISIEVLTPGAALLLPGGIVPEPATGLLVALALLSAPCRRARCC